MNVKFAFYAFVTVAMCFLASYEVAIISYNALHVKTASKQFDDVQNEKSKVLTNQIAEAMQLIKRQEIALKTATESASRANDTLEECSNENETLAEREKSYKAIIEYQFNELRSKH